MEMLEMLSKISYTKIIFFGFINRLDTLDTESETLQIDENNPSKVIQSKESGNKSQNRVYYYGTYQSI